MLKNTILALSVLSLAACATKEKCDSCCDSGAKPKTGSAMSSATSMAKKGAAATPQGQMAAKAAKAADQAKKQ